jgi:hypothetical protein
MTTQDAFAHWTGDACTGDRKRQSLYAEAALQLGQQYPCTAGKGVSGEGFTEAADRAAWRHAVGAKAAAIFLLSPAGRKALTSTTETTATEAGEGSKCDPKTTTETVQAGARLDPDKLAQLAEEDALDHVKGILCVKDSLKVRTGKVGVFGLSGPSRARRCGCR